MQCERLESENEGLRRQLASFRDQCREAEDKLAQQVTAASSEGWSVGLRVERLRAGSRGCGVAGLS